MSAARIRRAVWLGKIKKTAGGLTKKDLMENRYGKIVSIKKYKAGLKAMERLRKSGRAAAPYKKKSKKPKKKSKKPKKKSKKPKKKSKKPKKKSKKPKKKSKK